MAVEVVISLGSLGRPGGPGYDSHLCPPPEPSTSLGLRGQLSTAGPETTGPRGSQFHLGMLVQSRLPACPRAAAGLPGPQPEPGVSGHCGGWGEGGWLRKL